MPCILNLLSNKMIIKNITLLSIHNYYDQISQLNDDYYFI